MSNSSLVNYTKLSPYFTEMSDKVNRKITIHHMAGNLSVETCGNVFQTAEASANYGIGSDGRVGLYVDESNRSWASADRDNDSQAVTIEVANDEYGGSWHVSDTAFEKLIDLCVDICERNGIDKLVYTGDTDGNLTRHNMFIETTCPGPYLQSKFPEIVERVNSRLGVNINEEDEIMYKTINEVPGWAKPTIQKLVDKRLLQGDENGDLNLTESMVRIFVVLDRAGNFN